MSENGPVSVSAAIKSDGRSLRALALDADIDYKTVQMANANDRWPAQLRTRRALAGVLGIDESSTRA